MKLSEIKKIITFCKLNGVKTVKINDLVVVFEDKPEARSGGVATLQTSIPGGPEPTLEELMGWSSGGDVRPEVLGIPSPNQSHN